MMETVIICSANQWTGFYMITASLMEELKRVPKPRSSNFHDDHEFSKLAVTCQSVIHTNQIFSHVFKTLMTKRTCTLSPKPC